MDIVNLTHKQLIDLPIVGYGGNSDIRCLNYKDVAKIYSVDAILTGIDNCNFYSSESDEGKVEFLHNKEKIDYVVLPKKKVYVDDSFAGFSMEHIKSSKELLYLKQELSVQKRIDILIKIKNLLLEMFKQDMYMTDLNSINIIIKNHLPYVIDVDGVSFDIIDLDYVLEKFYHLTIYFLYDNIDFDYLIDFNNVEPQIKQVRKRNKLNQHIHQVIDDIDEIEKVGELILKYDKPYLNANF